LKDNAKPKFLKKFKRPQTIGDSMAVPYDLEKLSKSPQVNK